jgi:hypothetical protein
MSEEYYIAPIVNLLKSDGIEFAYVLCGDDLRSLNYSCLLES